MVFMREIFFPQIPQIDTENKSAQIREISGRLFPADAADKRRKESAQIREICGRLFSRGGLQIPAENRIA